MGRDRWGGGWNRLLIVAGSPATRLLRGFRGIPEGLRGFGRGYHSLPQGRVWSSGRCSSKASDPLRVTQTRDLYEVTNQLKTKTLKIWLRAMDFSGNLLCDLG